MTSNYDENGGHGGVKNDGGSQDCGCCGPSGPGCENMILLGKLPDMDPYEYNIGAERAVSTLGGTSYGNATDPLFRKLVEVRANDENGDGVIRTNDGVNGRQAETITHDADGDGVPENYRVDFDLYRAQYQRDLSKHRWLDRNPHACGARHAG